MSLKQPIPFLITRASNDSTTLKDALIPSQFRAIDFPLTEIIQRPILWDKVFEGEKKQHLIATSAHGLASLSCWHKIHAIWLVGEHTKEAIPDGLDCQVHCFETVSLLQNAILNSDKNISIEAHWVYSRGERIREDLKSAMKSHCDIEEYISYAAIPILTDIKPLLKKLGGVTSPIIISFFSIQSVLLWEKFAKKNAALLEPYDWIAFSFSKIISEAFSSDFLWYDKKYCSKPSMGAFLKQLNCLFISEFSREHHDKKKHQNTHNA